MMQPTVATRCNFYAIDISTFSAAGTFGAPAFGVQDGQDGKGLRGLDLVRSKAARPRATGDLLGRGRR
jgi:hypothetical protein